MFTLGYAFRPWKQAKAIAGGADILRYVRETAAAHVVDEHRTSTSPASGSSSSEAERRP
jgi:cation diffusion facilitator CzcD-associated flavoprotein CzcO